MRHSLSTVRSSLFAILLLLVLCPAQAGDKHNFNPEWLLAVGDIEGAEQPAFDDSAWKTVTLPHAFNEDQAFAVDIRELTDTIVWYRKHFTLPAVAKGKKVFIEFEGVRQAADVYLNGQHVGLSENGVMAFGFDLTPYIKYGKENVIAVRVDNDWDYRERETDTRFQWNDRNFNANYGGITKNVWLHFTDRLYQTLPLYSNLGTTGQYVYASDIRVRSHSARITAQSEVKNEYGKRKTVDFLVELLETDGTLLRSFPVNTTVIEPGQTVVLEASEQVDGLHFWSWGYGYLYDVRTTLLVDGKPIDRVTTRTGFRKTAFGNGMVWLNDRVLQVKGYAQRTTNEWPALGVNLPPWLSDYSNALMVESNANTVRWMHFTPSKQDVESCDRVGLIQAMPAGDAEKDREGRQWEQRKELMRDAIIYNRNNPSILFYECGNESISREHMVEMKQIRDLYDPYGGRAIGSREMLDIREAEYGGEMLYINKSSHHPMWAMEYCRDEGLRKYWDNYSYPYHQEGTGNDSFLSAMSGQVQKKVDASAYNHNQDSLAIENIIRWFDYYRERPGTGDRVSSGGVKIIFSDTNTHHRGVENYRRSGVTDAMRIPKDAFFVHQVMWDGWVDIERPRAYIIGHWNYEPGTVKPVNVVATAESVELLLNGKSLGRGERRYHFIHAFDSVAYEPGELLAVGYDEEGSEVCRYSLQTAGSPAALKLSALTNPVGWMADGADVALVQVEVVDADGRRCPLANDVVHFSLEGPAEYRGGIAQDEDNGVLHEDLPVECGVNRVLLRSLTEAGDVRLTATANGLPAATLELSTRPVAVANGISEYNPSAGLKPVLTRGETPLTPSYVVTKNSVRIASAIAGANQDEADKSFDDNELSEWTNDGRLSTAWITYKLDRRTAVDEMCIKLTGWRMRSYPLEVYAGDELVWSGETEKSLGYIHLPLKPVISDSITIRLHGESTESDQFGQIVEVAAPAAGELDLYKAKDGDKTKHELRIVEVEFKENVRQ